MDEFGAWVSEIWGVLPYATERRKASLLVQSTLAVNADVLQWDDAVTLGIRVLCSRWALTICLWMISYVLVMVEVMCGGVLTIIIFLPMWIGSVFAIISVIVVLSSTCSNTRLVSLEQRLFLRSRGDINDTDYIDYDSLPLLRRLFCWGIVSALFAAMAVVTQVLFYLWLVVNAIGMWNALLPIAIMFVLLLCYMWAMSTISVGTCGIASILLLDGVLFCMKLSGDISLSWLTISIPMMLVQVVWSGHLIIVASQVFRSVYELTYKQRISLSLYLVSFLLSFVAEFITCVMEENSGSVPLLLWTFAVPFFMIGGIIIMREEGSLMASSRGYIDPQPLSRTDEGWETLSSSITISLLLGTIVVSKTLRLDDREVYNDDYRYDRNGHIPTYTIVERGLNRDLISNTSMTAIDTSSGRKASGELSEFI